MALTNYRFWLKTSGIFQFITAGMHSLSLFAKPQPTNDTEKQLLDLMTTYHLDFGMGFTPTMADVMNSFSISFLMLLLFGGAINWVLVLKHADIGIIKAITTLSVITFGVCAIAMFFLTFIFPVVCTAVIFIALLVTWFTIPKTDSVQG